MIILFVRIMRKGRRLFNTKILDSSVYQILKVFPEDTQALDIIKRKLYTNSLLILILIQSGILYLSQ